MVKICFTGIFRNEEKNVKRCLDSVKKAIDYVSICDTGSTDNTIKLIKEWGKQNGKPTKVHHEPFKNFGHNRTLSFKLAKESFPNADYCLLIDADMVLIITPLWRKNSLTKDQYHLRQKNNYIEYWNTRLISTKYDWLCTGVTHEYWETKTPHTNEDLDSLWIDDKEDGGCKGDKLTRDKRLLLGGLNDEDTPQHLKVRYMFYLGSTLKNMGEIDHAIMWFTKRVNAGGWSEECFYAQMEIGKCYEITKRYNQAAGAYLQAWELRPTRAESLYQLAKMYRLQGKNQLGLLFSLKGKEITYPKNDKLFVEFSVYDYLFDQEISIVAFYVPLKKHIGKQSVQLLLKRKKSLPKSVYNLAVSNAKHYKIKYR